MKTYPKSFVSYKADTDELVNRLEETASKYDDNKDDWEDFGLAYRGGRDYLEDILERHERESTDNFNQRLKEAFIFNYCRKIAELFGFYLTQKPPIRSLGSLGKDPLWEMFSKDCDHLNTDFNEYLQNNQLLASVYGHVGILVDKPPGLRNNREEEIVSGTYPYCATYLPVDIRDWYYEESQATYRNELVYLKLYESDDDRYVCWWKDHFEIWKLIRDEDETGTGSEKIVGASLVREGANPLGEIPFVWMLNVKDPLSRNFGLSDLRDIHLIQDSITRDLTYGEEIIKYAAFPMLLEPDYGTAGSADETGEVPVGVKAVKTFDPENPEAVPKWLEAAVAEPIDAMIRWIGQKVDEIFEMAHLAGVHATQSSREARSGVALRYEFQMMSSLLSKKAQNMNEAELSIIKFWLKWQKQDELFGQVEIKRSKDFSLEDLAENLDNLKRASKMVISRHFEKMLQKHVAKNMLPDIPQVDMEKIIDEIMKNTERAKPDLVRVREHEAKRAQLAWTVKNPGGEPAFPQKKATTTLDEPDDEGKKMGGPTGNRDAQGKFISASDSI